MVVKSVIWPVIGIAILVFLASCLGTYIGMPDQKPVTATATVDTNQLASALAGKISVIATLDNATTDKINSIASEVLKSDTKENMALTIAKDTLTSRDFKKDLTSFLNDEITSGEIESYRDIASVSIKDSDVEVDGDEAEVTFDIKVSYYLDGDSDVEDLQKAKVTVTVNVEDLDEDENYIDADTAEYDFELVKFYD